MSVSVTGLGDSLVELTHQAYAIRGKIGKLDVINTRLLYVKGHYQESAKLTPRIGEDTMLRVSYRSLITKQ